MLKTARKQCESAPADPRAWSELGRVHALLEDFVPAVDCFARAVQLDERFADGWHNLGTALKKLGEREAALLALKRALSIDPARADTYLNLGNLLIDAGQLEDAVECFERAARFDPRLAAARSRLAEHLVQEGRAEQAEQLFRQSVTLDPDHVHGWVGLGRTLEDIGDAEGALGCYSNVLARRPTHAFALGQYFALMRAPASEERLASAYAVLGQQAGRAQLKSARPELSNAPSSDEAQANEQRMASANTALDEARPRPSSADATDEARALVGYGVAKYHDRRGEYERAAAAGSIANAARRRARGALDREALRARVDGLIATYDAEFFFQRRRFGLGTDQPVFIVGLPRSGTTLCEQILSSHPSLHGAGELPDLARLAVRALQFAGEAAHDAGEHPRASAAMSARGDALNATRRPPGGAAAGCARMAAKGMPGAAAASPQPWQAASLLTEMRSRELGLSYLRALRQGAPKRRLRISDKSPLNFFQLGLAALLFPNARVIHCTRDARDNALSIWMENFNPDHQYATDFDDLAFYRRDYQRLMAHWRDVLPLKTLELRYEDTVADLETQTRRLIEFLGVKWDARCLDFHRNARTVQTPSRWQVRQPIYTRSLERWRHYAPYLPDLIASFSRFES